MEGIVLLFTYAAIMLALTFRNKAGDGIEFNVADRKIGTWSGALSIAATWIWAPALFVSAEKAYVWGWKGLAWFLVPNILCIVFFSPFANKLRKIFPDGITLSGFMQSHYGSRSVGNVYRFQLGSLAFLSTGVQLLAGGKILSVITGIPFWLMTVILSAIAYSYSRKGGIMASVKTDALQMVLILLICFVSVPWALKLQGFGSLARGLSVVGTESGMEIMIGFGLPTAIGLLSGQFGDQSFWQRAFSIKESSLKKSFVIGALVFGLVPLSMGTLGFVAGGSGIYFEETGFVNFELIKAILPAWFMIPFLFMVVSGLISTVDSNLCAMASLVSDFTDKLRHARISMVVLLVVGILIANIPNVTVTDLFLFYGTLRASTLSVTLLTLCGKKLHPTGVSAGVVLSIAIGLPVFAVGSVCGIAWVKLAVSILTLAISGAFALIYTKEERLIESRESEDFGA